MFCKYDSCNNKIIKLIGKCKLCNYEYCVKHRYTEAHNCIKLIEFKTSKKQLLISKLLDESMSNKKLHKI